MQQALKKKDKQAEDERQKAEGRATSFHAKIATLISSLPHQQVVLRKIMFGD